MQGFTGVSFPFRINKKGGIAMSSTDLYEVPHIEESIAQIVRTRALERVMEAQIHCDASTYLFDPNDASTAGLIAYEVQTAIEECDDRIEVLSVTPHAEDNVLYTEISFRVKKYEKTYSVNTKVGDIE